MSDHSPLPWRIVDDDECGGTIRDANDKTVTYLKDFHNMDDADFIVAAVNALATLPAMEWAGCGCSYPEAAACPACKGGEPLNERDRRMPEYYGHRPDCPLMAALKVLQKARAAP